MEKCARRLRRRIASGCADDSCDTLRIASAEGRGRRGLGMSWREYDENVVGEWQRRRAAYIIKTKPLWYAVLASQPNTSTTALPELQ